MHTDILFNVLNKLNLFSILDLRFWFDFVATGYLDFIVGVFLIVVYLTINKLKNNDYT